MVLVGDRRRFREFTRFIADSFPTARTVADVAGGRGELAFRLFEIGKVPVIIDPRDTTFPRWVHRELRKRGVREGRISTIERWRSGVEETNLGGFDLIVAMHPDEATELALRAAVTHDIDFAIVPCCVFPLDGVKRSRREWLDHLMSLAPGIRTAELPITGANVILWRKQGDGVKEWDT
jgi:hypothetical protein